MFTKEEAREQFHLTGPFDFIIEGKEPMSFGYDPAAPLFTQTVPGGDYKTSPGTARRPAVARPPDDLLRLRPRV